MPHFSTELIARQRPEKQQREERLLCSSNASVHEIVRCNGLQSVGKSE
jgi:hypothetical protein